MISILSLHLTHIFYNKQNESIAEIGSNYAVDSAFDCIKCVLRNKKKFTKFKTITVFLTVTAITNCAAQCFIALLPSATEAARAVDHCSPANRARIATKQSFEHILVER